MGGLFGGDFGDGKLRAAGGEGGASLQGQSIVHKPTNVLGTGTIAWVANGSTFLPEGGALLGENFDYYGWVDVRNHHTGRPASDAPSTLNLVRDGNFERMRTIELPDGVCATAVVPTQGNGIAVVTNKGIFLGTVSGVISDFPFNNLQAIRDAGRYSAAERPNDCRVTPDGALHVSFMGEGPYRTANPYAASVWRVDGRESGLIPEQVMKGLEIPNGHVFVPFNEGGQTGHLMFFNDTFRPKNAGSNEHFATTDIYFVSSDGRSIRNLGRLIDYREAGLEKGFPDGMALYGDHILVPMFDGGVVAAVNWKTRSLTGVFEIDAKQVTSIAVVPGTNKAYVTTGNERIGVEDLYQAAVADNDRNAGSIFTLDLSPLEKGTVGPKAHRFIVP